MRSDFKGILLCAVGIDALGSLVSLCYECVSIGDENNLAWFLSCFKVAFKHSLPYDDNVTFLSDRQKGVINAVGVYFPHAAHGLCVKHLLENLKKQINNQVVNSLLRELAASKSPTDYNEKMNQIRQISERAAKYLAGVDKRDFVDAFFAGKRFGDYTSNISESLNSRISLERDGPIALSSISGNSAQRRRTVPGEAWEITQMQRFNDSPYTPKKMSRIFSMFS